MRRASGSGRAPAGYTLIVLVIAVAVLNILVAASLPYWSHVIQRDKEEELVARGLQYAEAIRLYQMKYQHPPVRLDELILGKPRFIRQLWKDPITDEKFRPVFVNQPDPGSTGMQGGPDPTSDPNLPQQKGEEVAVGPIKGVVSSSHKESLLIFNGRNHYDEWQFNVELLQGTPPQPGAPPSGAFPTPMRWIGRPFALGNDPFHRKDETRLDPDDKSKNKNKSTLN